MEFLIRHLSSRNTVPSVPLFLAKKPGLRLSAQCGSHRKDGLPVGGVGIHGCSFSGPNLEPTSNLLPSHHGPNGHSFSTKCGSDPPRRQRADGHSFASPQAVDAVSFFKAAKLQCCALRVGVLRASAPTIDQKRPCMSPRPPGAIRFKCIPGEQGCLSSPACVVQLQLDRGVMSVSLYFI